MPWPGPVSPYCFTCQVWNDPCDSRPARTASLCIGRSTSAASPDVPIEGLTIGSVLALVDLPA